VPLEGSDVQSLGKPERLEGIDELRDGTTAASRRQTKASRQKREAFRLLPVPVRW
jgi:hypothetical protein